MRFALLAARAFAGSCGACCWTAPPGSFLQGTRLPVCACAWHCSVPGAAPSIFLCWTSWCCWSPSAPNNVSNSPTDIGCEINRWCLIKWGNSWNCCNWSDFCLEVSSKYLCNCLHMMLLCLFMQKFGAGILRAMNHSGFFWCIRPGDPSTFD